MTLSTLDWLLLGWYFILSLGLGLYYARKAGRNVGEYFAGGRSLPWWLLGTSMVATSFSSDTPLAVTGIVLKDGVSGNWFWWAFLFGGSLTVMFYARLWRRSSVLTEVEFIELRYNGRAARVLRGFKALYLALPASGIAFGWVTLAMVSIIKTVFGTNALIALALCLTLTVIYTVVSGLWGVVATDLLLFGVSLLGAVLLAVTSVEKAGGMTALLESVRAVSAETGRDFLSPVPSFGKALPLAFFAALFVQWWAVYYPGAEPGGGGWMAQRMLAAKSPRDAALGTLWFNLAHYIVRPWPWIVTALAALALSPSLARASPAQMEAAYPGMLVHLPHGILGLTIASFFAAYMSTIESILNLAGSYLLNDFYKPFLKPGATERHYVRVSRVAVLLVALFGTGMTLVLGTVKAGWALVMEFSAGVGLVLLLRWYWWRITAWSEIAAFSASAAMSIYLKLDPDSILVRGAAALTSALGFDADPWAVKLLIIVAFTTAVWLLVTLMGPAERPPRLLRFFERVRPGGAWGPVAAIHGRRYSTGWLPLAGWVASVMTILFFLLGLGNIIFLEWREGALLLGGGLVSAVVLSRILESIDREDA